MSLKVWCLSTVLLSLVCVPDLDAADWPRFRGPAGAGVSLETGLPVEWSATRNVAWKAPLPGPGASSPIVLGGRVFLTSYDGYGVSETSPGKPDDLERRVLCLDREDGRVLWNKKVKSVLPAQPYEGFLTEHGFASSTPACDGERLYVFFGRSGLLAFDLDGRQLWQADLGSGKNGWGSATSPVLYDDLVIVNAFVESRSLVGVNKTTGEIAWRLEGLARSWSTPALVETAAGKTELVISMQGALWGVDPKSGKRLWTCRGIDDYVCPSLVASDGVVFAIGGRRGAALAVRAGGRGEVSDSHLVWEAKAGSNVPSPVFYNGHLYWVDHRGLAYCLDAATGEIVYRQRLPQAGRVYASVIEADGRLYAVTRERGTFVIAARPQFELLAHNDLSPDASLFNASPAVSGGHLFLRSNEALYCIGPK